MSTILQQDLAEAIVKNTKLPRDKRMNKKELVASVGYATKVAQHKQTSTIQAKGVQDSLKEWGLTEELITTSLVYDIKNKPKSRVKELGLGAEILNMKQDKSVNINFNQVNISNEEKDKAKNAIKDLIS